MGSHVMNVDVADAAYDSYDMRQTNVRTNMLDEKLTIIRLTVSCWTKPHFQREFCTISSISSTSPSFTAHLPSSVPRRSSSFLSAGACCFCLEYWRSWQVARSAVLNANTCSRIISPTLLSCWPMRSLLVPSSYHPNSVLCDVIYWRPPASCAAMMPRAPRSVFVSLSWTV